MRIERNKCLITFVLISFLNVLQNEVSDMKSQLSQWFMPDDEYPMGVPPFMGTQQSFSHMDIHDFDQVMFSI